jgi:hypothetical protein
MILCIASIKKGQINSGDRLDGGRRSVESLKTLGFVDFYSFLTTHLINNNDKNRNISGRKKGFELI